MTAWYCEHHQAWFASAMVTRQTGEEDVRVLQAEAIEFGPFDAAGDVWATAQGWLRAGMAAAEAVAGS